MPQSFKLLALGGDGIGPEVVGAGLELVELMAGQCGIKVEIEEDLLHGAAWDRFGTFCRDETLAAALKADAVLVGAVGGPKWDAIRVPGGAEMQDGLMRLRKGLETYAGLRPVKAIACLEGFTPFRSGHLAGVDVMVLREMCGGAFFGSPRGIEDLGAGKKRGFDLSAYTSDEIERFARVGFELARRRRKILVSADKANVMETYAVWREVVGQVARDYPDVAFAHLYADNCSYQLMRDPKAFDVILSDNLFGDILSDQAAVIAGSLGMLPSACLRACPKVGESVPGIYEPVHGTAPDIAGKGLANPIGTLLSVAMMFDHTFVQPQAAHRIEAAVATVLEQRHRPPDLGGQTGTQAFTDLVLAALKA